MKFNGLTVLLIIIVLVMGFYIYNGMDEGSEQNDGTVTDTSSDPLAVVPVIIQAQEFDSLDDCHVGYSVSGAVLTSYFYENGQYNIVAYHGATKETATIVTSNTIDITHATTKIIQDYDAIEGGKYAPGNGALGFKVTNNNHDTTCFVWLWEA